MNYQDGFMIWEDSTIKKYDAESAMDFSEQSYFLKNCIRRDDFNQLLYDIASQINENQDDSITWEDSTIKKYDAESAMDFSEQSYFLKNCIRRDDFNQLLYDIASQINENQDDSITWES